MAIHNSYIVVFVLTGFGSHCLMAPAAAGAERSRIFGSSSKLTYSYETTLLFNEVDPGRGKDVGFQISGALSLETVWQSPESHENKLLRVELMNPKLLIKSRKAPAPEGFVSHVSKLEDQKNSPFLIHWNDGRVNSVYINQNEAISLVNLKKGIASFFQFQTNNKELRETDASGDCKVEYSSLDKTMIEKVKSECQTDLPLVHHPDQLWGADVSSRRRSVIVLTPDLSAIESIDTEERHMLALPLRQEVGGAVINQQNIKLQDRSPGNMLIQESTLDAALKNLEKQSGLSLAKHPITLTMESKLCMDGTCPSFFSLVKENRDALLTSNLGTSKSATAFIKLLNFAREAKKEDLIKTLKSSKNKNILLQLMDLMGAAQTLETHSAALTVLDFKSADSLDLNERYLWSLSFGSHPLTYVLKDLMKVLNSGPYNKKLDETITLTIAAMAGKLKKKNETATVEIVKDVIQLLITKLKGCSTSDDDCSLKYIRALKNLASEETLPMLLMYATTGSRKVSVAAINAVHRFSPCFWTQKVIKTAKQIYFQLDKRYDSSARTLALDILLESKPDKKVLFELLESLTNQDPTYEVKQYLRQRIQQISERDGRFASTIHDLMTSLNYTTNYNILSQRGFSTAFTRSFMSHQSANGTLSTIQEMSGGVVKRGLVDVIIDKGPSTETIFSLGLFAGGLSSFLSSDESDTEEGAEEEEVATAGMDLTVMGVQVRPFEFFSGQGELMGHVWSGTASERTAAFQALGLLQDHVQYIPIGAGFLADLSLHGAVSFDLSGQISLSLWNRNAESLVEKSAGLSVTGLIRVNTMFVHSQVQFNLGTEVKLRLVSNIDFYSDIALCLQLQQPSSVIKHNIHKVERIPGSKHRLRKSKYKVIPVSGRTYALNKKNNEFCNVIFRN